MELCTKAAGGRHSLKRQLVRKTAGRSAPSLSWCARVLPEDETSQVAVEWGSSEDFDLLSYWKEEENNLKSVRSGTDATPSPIVGDALPTIDSIRPVTDLALSWLIGDLRELGWTDLSKLSFR